MRRLTDAIVKPTVSYSCEVLGALCSGNLQPGLEGMAGLQIAFFRQHLKLRKSISLHVISAELADAPWQCSSPCFRKAMLAQDMSVWIVWEGLHIWPRGAPSRGAKLCTYLRWFARLDRISTEPYYRAAPSSDKAQIHFIHFPFSSGCSFLAD